MKTEDIKNEIENCFSRLQTSGDVLIEVKGQLSISFNFENESQYDEVVSLLQEEWEHYNHNFQLKSGLSVFLLMD